MSPGANQIALGKVTTYSKGRTALHPVRREISMTILPSHFLNRPIQISLLTD